MHREHTCCGDVKASPQCGITPAFQLICMLRRERHNLRSGYTYRAIHVDGAKDLLHLQAAMHGLQSAHYDWRNVHPHWSFARYIPCVQPYHPAMYNPSPLSPAARSNPLRYIISAWGGIARPHVARTTMLGVIQVPPSLCAMQAMREGLYCTPKTVQTR